MEKVLDAPQPPELRGLSRGELRDRLWRNFGGPEPIRPWAGPLSDIYYGWMSLGRDVNGISLYSERDSWLVRNGWTDPGELEAGHYFFQVLEGEASAIHQILYPPT